MLKVEFRLLDLCVNVSERLLFTEQILLLLELMFVWLTGGFLLLALSDLSYFNYK